MKELYSEISQAATLYFEQCEEKISSLGYVLEPLHQDPYPDNELIMRLHLNWRE